MISEKAHNLLSCTTCNKALADVVVTKEADVTFSYMALCPYCNGESELKSITGLVHTGSVAGTVLSDRKTTDNKVVLHLKKERV